MTNHKITSTEEVTGASFPSADLINFRFDQNDKAVAKLDAKMDKIFGQIVTPKDLAEAKVEGVAQHLILSNRLDKLEAWNAKVTWLVLSTVILAILATLGVKVLQT